MTPLWFLNNWWKLKIDNKKKSMGEDIITITWSFLLILSMLKYLLFTIQKWPFCSNNLLYARRGGWLKIFIHRKQLRYSLSYFHKYPSCVNWQILQGPILMNLYQFCGNITKCMRPQVSWPTTRNSSDCGASNFNLSTCEWCGIASVQKEWGGGGGGGEDMCINILILIIIKLEDTIIFLHGITMSSHCPFSRIIFLKMLDPILKIYCQKFINLQKLWTNWFYRIDNRNIDSPLDETIINLNQVLESSVWSYYTFGKN